jgi:hypothetical protein
MPRTGRSEYPDIHLFHAILLRTGYPPPPLKTTEAVRAVVDQLSYAGAPVRDKQPYQAANPARRDQAIRRVRGKFLKWIREMEQLGPIVPNRDDHQDHEEPFGSS